MIDVVFWSLAAYLIGSVPTAYLVGRLTKGIDIRQYGSGNVGGANTVATIGLRAGIIVAVIDIAKGAVVVGLARWLGQSAAVLAFSTVAVTAGHNWSIFLRFTGGRGMGAAFGASLFLDPLPLAVVSVPGFLLIGLAKILRWPILAEITLVFALAFPAAAWLLDSPATIVAGEVAMVGVLIAKRLLSNAGMLRSSEPMHRLLLYRLLFDRDIASYEEWVYRHPAETLNQPAVPDGGRASGHQ